MDTWSGDFTLPPRVGIVAFSFGHRLLNQRQSPTNIVLAAEVDRLIDKEPYNQPPLVVAQWEVSCSMDHVNHKIVAERFAQEGLSSGDVWDEAQYHFRKAEIREVIPVANPFLHLAYVTEMIERDGFQVRRERIKRIGYDPDSTQWWTRDPLRWMAYVALRKMGYERAGQKQYRVRSD